MKTQIAVCAVWTALLTSGLAAAQTALSIALPRRRARVQKRSFLRNPLHRCDPQMSPITRRRPRPPARDAKSVADF